MQALPPLSRLIAAALYAPVMAATPLLIVGFAAHLAGSASAALFVTTAFDLLTVALPAALLVGVPLAAVLARLGWLRTPIGALGGVGIALFAAMALPGHSMVGLDNSNRLLWATLLLYAALVGALFTRRAIRPGCRR